MPTKSNNKKKSRTGLIITIITAVVLLTAVILIVTKSWGNDSDSNDNPSYSSGRGGTIKIDQRFIQNIKDHKYKKLTSTRDFSLTNVIATLDERKSDGSYNIQVPSDWTNDTEVSFEGGFWSKDKLGFYVIETKFSFNFAREPENVDPADHYTPEEAMDRYIQATGALGPYEVIDQFNKEINDNDYQVAFVKFTGIDGGAMFKVIYVRLLDKGSLVPSYLVASTNISEEDKESNKDKILDNIYDLENTIGGFDESKQ